jgi:hypothetical protein
LATAENVIAVFLHIPKTGGTSIQAALDIQSYRNRRVLVKGARYSGLVTFGHELLPYLIRAGYVSGDLFTFAFVRNPYDRAVSLWAHWRREKAGRDLSFAEWCEQLDRQHWRVRFPQARWTDGLWLDFLGRYECLQADMDRLCDELGIARQELPHLNAGDRGPCRDYYNPATMETVRRHYARDFRQFGYADDCLPDR